MPGTQILDHESVDARLRRIAFEIVERNFNAKRIFVVGLDQRGGFLADRIRRHLSIIAPFEVEAVTVRLDRENRQGRGGPIGIHYDREVAEFSDQIVIVIDDVLYSGNTLLRVLAPLLPNMPRRIQIAVLIDRGHRSFPVSADYVGVELATALQDHVDVRLDEARGRLEAFLV